MAEVIKVKPVILGKGDEKFPLHSPNMTDNDFATRIAQDYWHQTAQGPLYITHDLGRFVVRRNNPPENSDIPTYEVGLDQSLVDPNKDLGRLVRFASTLASQFTSQEISLRLIGDHK